MSENRDLITTAAAGNGEITPSPDAPLTPQPQPQPQPPPPPPLHWTRVGVGEAIRWHWVTFLLPVFLITGLAILAGFLRSPDYTAEAKLSISDSAGGAAALAGFAANSQSLAAGFSQAVNAPGVVRRVGRRLGLSQAEIRSRVSASSTTGSPVLRIQAVSTTAERAVALANAAGAALIAYVNRSNDGDTAGQKRLLEEFRAATVRVNRLRSRLKSLKGSGAGSAEVNNARADLDAADLEAGAARDAYKASQASRVSAGQLQVLSPAVQAQSDRISKLQLLAFIGLLIGIAVGATLASIRANGWPVFG